jgi:hypothetical protein
MTKLALIALLAAVTPCANAQRGRTVLGVSHHRSLQSPAIFFSDPFYSDALYRDGYPAASQPPVIILQASPVAAPTPERPAPPPQPLMIELQGDRYVRVSGQESSTAEIIDPKMIAPKMIDQPMHSPRPPEHHSGAAIQSPATPQPAPAVLIFRDGHREEASGYTIADGVLYTHTDYYTAGSWNKKIALSSLNLPETIAANHSHNIKFQLPTAPNEVIVGP